MNTRIAISILAVGLVPTLIHCSDDARETDSTSGSGGSGGVGGAAPQAPATMKELFAKLAATPKTFTVKAEAGGKIEGENVSFKIPANSIHDMTAESPDADIDADTKPDSKLVTGTVTIELREFRTRGEMLRNNIPTQTKDGRILESGGSFVVKAFQGEKELRIAALVDVNFRNAPVSAENADKMILFVAKQDDGDFGWKQPPAVVPPVANPACDTAEECKVDKTCFEQPSCRPFLCQGGCNGLAICLGTQDCPLDPACEEPDACTANAQCIKRDCNLLCLGHCDEPQCAQVPACKPAEIPATGMSPDYLFNNSPFGSIGDHNAVNCDALSYLSADRVTSYVRFGSNYSSESGVFFIPDVGNTSVKLYTEIENPQPGEEGYKSYQEAMPVGVAGKLVIVSLKDGKYYYEELAHTIADDASAGPKTQTTVVNPVEVTEAEFFAAIEAL